MKYYSNTYIDNTLNKDNINMKYLFHYLYIITYIRVYRFKDRRYDKNDFVPINIDILRKIINYNKAVGFLKDLVYLGLIESNSTFSRKEHKSTGYRLSSNVLSHRFYIPTEVDEKLNFKIKNVYNKLKLKLIKEDNLGYGYVTECMEFVDINVETAKKSIIGLDTELREFTEMQIEQFSNKFFSKDRTGNRLHNNLTNLYTPLRNHLTYKNKQLVQCDLRNSQLVFLYLLMKDYHINPTELEKFKVVVCEYGFYEFFAEKIGVNLTDKTRKEFKIFVFEHLLFGANKTKLTDLENIFKEEFPNTFYVIQSIKTDNYKDLSIKLQRKESEFIFECIRKLNRSIPLLTIHDSVVTTVGNEQAVYNMIAEEFKEKYNIVTKIKIEIFA
jgi:hypothetical protein